MCVSALVETSPEKATSMLGLNGLIRALDFAPTRRIEARAPAYVMRLGAGDRLVAEPMVFNPYVVRRGNVTGDLWADGVFTVNHGIVAVRAFSEWVSALRLVRMGLVSPYDANCAYNRFAPAPGGLLTGTPDRLVLANFTPQDGGPLLVPVLFGTSRSADAAQPLEFCMITDDPPAEVALAGAARAPVSLSPQAALEWLHTRPESEDGSVDIDFEEVLEDALNEAYEFALYKSA